MENGGGNKMGRGSLLIYGRLILGEWFAWLLEANRSY